MAMTRGRTSGASARRSDACVESVQLGHLDVHQDDVVLLPLESLQRFAAVPHDVSVVAEPIEQGERNLLVHRIVLGEQDRKDDAAGLLRCAAGATGAVPALVARTDSSAL